MKKGAFPTGRFEFLSAVAGSILLLLVAGGCAQNTLAQDLAWERWRKCERVGTTGLKEIRPDGQIWFWYKSPMEYTFVRECLAKAAAEQAERRVAAAPVIAKEMPPATPGPVMPPVWKRGEEWAFRWESPRGNGTFVWSVDREEVIDGVEFFVVKAGQRELFYRKGDLAFYLEKFEGVVETRHVPPSALAWPLAPGKTWELKYVRERPRERQTKDIWLTCEAGPEEHVTVPAGTFRTFKIACRHQRTGSMSYELWVSPDVKHMVRERTYFSYGVRERELIGFRVK